MMLRSIRLRKIAWIAGAGLCLVMVGWAVTALDAAPKPKTPLSADQRPAFYVTRGFYDGAQALGACDPGFHMASIAEILNPTAVRYDTTRGHTTADSGGGPPYEIAGWIRTGLPGIQGTNVPGVAMCADTMFVPWSSNAPADWGTIVWLSSAWTNNAVTSISPYWSSAISCSTQRRVWCVQD